MTTLGKIDLYLPQATTIPRIDSAGRGFVATHSRVARRTEQFGGKAPKSGRVPS